MLKNVLKWRLALRVVNQTQGSLFINVSRNHIVTDEIKNNLFSLKFKEEKTVFFF